MSIEALEEQISALKVEYDKFEKGNKSAGTRARKVLQTIKGLCQEMRTAIQDAKKSDA
jgi:DnaJ-domain-containing protein 1